MINIKDTNKIKKFYNDNFYKYKDSVKTVGWSSKKDQYLRFEKLFENIEVNNKSILDIGCGLGDLIFFIKKKYKGKNFKYTGIDISDAIIDFAKTKHKAKNISFINGNFYNLNLSKYDIIISSGSMSLNLKLKEKDITKMITKMYNNCKSYVSMNFLSTYCDYQLTKNTHYSPEKIFSICKKLSNKVNLIHDYRLYEFTVQIIK